MKKIIKIASISAIALLFAACVYDSDFEMPQDIQPLIMTESIIVGEDTQFPLAGMLNLPVGASAQNPVPAAVIVQGSGPSDMDGNMFGVRPYYDIARFLAENGIASIRHDKRTLTHISQFDPTWTIYHESIADAILAAEILRADPRVDSNRIYIIGHSLGGMVAPRIHNAGGDFAGLILMAASPRHLLDIAIEQVAADLTIQTEMFMQTPEAQVPEILEIALGQIAEGMQVLEAFAAFSNGLQHMTAQDAMAIAEPIFGAFAYYWLDLTNNPMHYDLAQIDVPMLVLQGARDFQILADTDFVLLQETLGNRGNVQFVLYENLNHMFMPSVAANFVEHAMEIVGSAGRQVSPIVLHDIVNWINQR